MRRKKNKSQGNHTLLNDITWMVLVGICLILLIVGTGTTIHVTEDKHIAITPAEIKQIKDIGQWEFLSIEDEELVDTIRKGIFSDDELVRVYYGTVSLGVDLKTTKEGWITMLGDTVDVSLPPIQVLDPDIVDEAASKPFFETGKWNQNAREALYHKAKKQIFNRCFTRENIKQAQESAISHFQQLVEAMGYEHVKVHF
jgi:hypothetical protein